MNTPSPMEKLQLLDKQPGTFLTGWEAWKRHVGIESQWYQLLKKPWNKVRMVKNCCIGELASSGFRGGIALYQGIKQYANGKNDACKALMAQHDPSFGIYQQLTQVNDQLRDHFASQMLAMQMESILQLIEAKRKTGGHTILFLAPYFSGERLRDGYFQRVQAIDSLLSDQCLRIYASWLDCDQETRLMQCHVMDDNHLEIVYPHPHSLYDEAIGIIAKQAGMVYHHSITFFNEHASLLSDIIKIFDMHGAYPEEERLYGRTEQAARDEYHEQLAMEHGQAVICVTNAMKEHLLAKYPSAHIPMLILPIFNHTASFVDERINDCSEGHKPVVVYAGGMQKWQCVKEMQHAIYRCLEQYEFHIFTGNPEEFWKTWHLPRPKKGLLVAARTKEALQQEYQQCQYGFLLRQDITVNHVACPTKLIEYMEYGIIPIMSTSRVGDFVQNGMQYVSLNDFIHGKLPSEQERKAIATRNREVLKCCLEKQRTGSIQLQRLLFGESVDVDSGV